MLTEQPEDCCNLNQLTISTSGVIDSWKIAIVYWLSVSSSTHLKVQNALKELPKGINKDPVTSSVSVIHCSIPRRVPRAKKMEKTIPSRSRPTSFSPRPQPCQIVLRGQCLHCTDILWTCQQLWGTLSFATSWCFWYISWANSGSRLNF